MQLLLCQIFSYDREKESNQIESLFIKQEREREGEGREERKEKGREGEREREFVWKRYVGVCVCVWVSGWKGDMSMCRGEAIPVLICSRKLLVP